MKNGFRALAAVLVLGLVLAGCDIRYPSSRTDIPDERPSIAFQGAPDGSVVFVDGNAMGPATKFDGTNVLLVEPGNHVVEVRLGKQVLLTRRVFLSGQATRTFVVR